MANDFDPNNVLLTGENSFIRLHGDEGSPLSIQASHWRILYSPNGSGHVLYIKGDLTDEEPRIYSDNIAMARWLQNEIEQLLNPDFTDLNIPVIDAAFNREGDPLTTVTEVIESDEDSILMSWYDFQKPFMMTLAVGSNPDRAHLGVYSCFIPARRAQLTINGEVSDGHTKLEKRGPNESSSSCLAWSETWVKS